MTTAASQLSTSGESETSTQDARLLRVPFEVVAGKALPEHVEPIVCGLPLPFGRLHTWRHAWLEQDGQRIGARCQLQPLASWADGSIRWLLLSFPAHVAPDQQARYELCISSAGAPQPVTEIRRPCDSFAATGDARLELSATSRALTVREEAPEAPSFHQRAWRLPRHGERLLESISLAGHELLSREGITIECLDAQGRARRMRIETLSVVQDGPHRCDVRFAGRVRRAGGLLVSGCISIFAMTGLMRVEAVLENPSRARHRGGCWDLGDPGSIRLSGWRLAVHLSDAISRGVHWRESPDAAVRHSATDDWSITQYSSGGENWKSRNHVDRAGKVPLEQRGYRVRAGAEETCGMRAAPTVTVETRGVEVSGSLEDFWRKFPSGLRVSQQRIQFDFWPQSPGAPYELQGGERCSRVAWLRFAAPAEGARVDLAWTHQPAVARVSAKWLAESAVIPWIPASHSTTRDEYREIAAAALDGARSFFAKRETIDEYGWRNFGDLWADHEAAYYDGPQPIISHYNNQYDPLHSFLIQFLLTGDRRWWELAAPLARHVMDIDIYHTAADKAAYSGGLFWHTAHYLDAGTCTHRTYSRAMNGTSGGPANEQAYASGLLLYYWLTGDARAKDAVLGLAEWIRAMDDGRRHVLGLVCPAPTGGASATTTPDYHGPGRGAGNAIGVLLDAWQAGGEPRYLEFAEQLIRRTVHPADDVTARDLNNFELRWSHSVYFLQLARYLHLTEHGGAGELNREYVRDAMLHYARWMAQHGKFSLDYPEQLEYPTETWAAQELRRGNVLLAAAALANGPERELLQSRGREVLDVGWRKLMSYESRVCTRPLAIALQQGYIERYFGSADAGAPEIPSAQRYGDSGPERFVPQKERVRAILRSPRLALAAGRHFVNPATWYEQCRRSWTAQYLRRRWSERV